MPSTLGRPIVAAASASISAAVRVDAMLAESRGDFVTAPWLALFPGLAISIALLGINIFGDALRDRLDPRMVSICEDLPEETNRVTLDPDLTDRDGVPAPKITYRLSDNTRKMLDHSIARGTEILKAAGAHDITVKSPLPYAGWHLLGTARMVEMNGQPRAAGSPFGGVGHSGLAREGGVWGLEEYVIAKSVSGWGGSSRA